MSIKQRAKFSWPMVILASITLVLSSWGLFELAHIYGGMPAALAIVAVTGFDLTAVAAGSHAMKVAEDGDSGGPWALVVVGAAVLSSILQFMHTRLAGQSWAVGVMMAAFPIATVLLFEGTLRRAHRLNGRRTGRVAKPRATFELLQWAVYPKATFWAFRASIADRSLGGGAAFLLGIEATTERPIETDDETDTRRKFERDYLTGQIRELPGSDPDSAAESAGPDPDSRTVTELVQASLQVRGADLEAVKADVLKARPAANPDTIRRTFGKLSGPKAANG
ncbi:MAG TPA: DUF2637 domain-containing protein [Mycobacterium sp.]|uniref:DUF2637 domain-containing protein n=1 Tax=Mycobacterium sp. TaxID=1785 RepID=UPI002F3F459C